VITVEKVREELEFCQGDSPLTVEINGVVHDIHNVTEDSQGVTLIIDTDEEERSMR
jgi:hypothetical protein